jgi:hypothetical protein
MVVCDPLLNHGRALLRSDSDLVDTHHVSDGPARRRAGRLLVTTVVTIVAGTASIGSGSTAQAAVTLVPGAPGCPMFPADNVWNTDIATLPVNADNAEWMASLDAANTLLHPDFGPSGDPSNPYGIPYTVVPAGHPFVSITFQYSDESDKGPYPLGSDTPIEGGQDATGDRHAIMVDPSTCTLYELYDAHFSPSGSTAGSGAIWNLRSDALRPEGWTSADAAGLPILPGLVNYDEAASGSMDHAIRFTAVCTQDAYIWPARHEAGQANPQCPPMGARFRLNANFSLPVAQCSAMCQTVITTMKNYGLILADNGSNWYFQGTADTRWTETEVDQLKQIPASSFEAVDESSLMVNVGSGQTATPNSAVSPKPTWPTRPTATPTPTTVSRVSTSTSVASPAPSTTVDSTAAASSGLPERHRPPQERDPATPVGDASLHRDIASSDVRATGFGPLAWIALAVSVLAISVGSLFGVRAFRHRRRTNDVMKTPAEDVE